MLGECWEWLAGEVSAAVFADHRLFNAREVGCVYDYCGAVVALFAALSVALGVCDCHGVLV